MKIKRYLEYSEYGIRQELLSYFDNNRHEIESKGMDFADMRSSLRDSLARLDDGFLHSVAQRFSSLPKDGVAFEKGFEDIMKDILAEISRSNESFAGDVFSLAMGKIRGMAKWVSDRIFTISGIATIGVAGILFAMSHFGSGFGIPKGFENATINSVLVLGATAYAFGQKNDEYKQKSDI